MIILRDEKFGGIVFSDKNAAQVFLDYQGFSVFKKYIEDINLKFSQDEKKFIKKTLKVLDVQQVSEVKIIKNIETKNRKYSFEVLNSPTLADIQITNCCNLRCPHCYANSVSRGRNITWKDLILALDSFSNAGVFQVALGGGEPTLHPKFRQILRAVRERGMLPNLTTNGVRLTCEMAKAMSEYCGAIALSVEGIENDFQKRRNFEWKKLCKSADILKKYGNRLVFQITVSDSNIIKLPKIVERLLSFEPYGLIFLAYKPAGRGTFFDGVLSYRDYNVVKNIIKDCLDKIKSKTKIGFDCCFVQGIVELAKEVSPFNFKFIEGCSALRNSLAVTMDLDIVPCSFINYSVGNLHLKSLKDIWEGKEADKFRNKFCKNIENSLCKNCLFKHQCMGGCPEFKLTKCSKF